MVVVTVTVDLAVVGIGDIISIVGRGRVIYAIS